MRILERVGGDFGMEGERVQPLNIQVTPFKKEGQLFELGKDGNGG